MALLKGYLYIIADVNNQFMKIGMSRDVRSQLVALQTVCPLELVIVGHFFCTYATFRKAKTRLLLEDLHIRNEWYRYDEVRARAAIEEALAIPDDTIRAIRDQWPSKKGHNYPVKRMDTGEVFSTPQEAAAAVLGSRKLASKIRLAVKTGCQCGPCAWEKVY